MATPESFHGIPGKPDKFVPLENIPGAGLNPEEALIARQEVISQEEQDELAELDALAAADEPPKDIMTEEEATALEARFKKAGRQMPEWKAWKLAKSRRMGKRTEDEGPRKAA